MPAKSKTKAAPNKSNKLSKDDLTYLAGMYEATIGLRSVGTVNAAAISNTEDWPQYMARKFGGEAREFVSGRGKKFWGWFVGLEDRLRLLQALGEADTLVTMTAHDRDKIQAKLERAIESGGEE